VTPARQAQGFPTSVQLLGEQAAKLRCLDCAGAVELTFLSERPGYPDLGPDGTLTCSGCGTDYPLIAGTPRMLAVEHRRALRDHYPLAAQPPSGDRDRPVEQPDADAAVKRRTAASFAYEWQHFGGLRDEWQENFADYLRPHAPASLAGREILDVGTGSGRHSFHAARAGGRVVAVDLGASIDVARRNLPPSVLTVQADAEALPFAPESFDLVMSIGVLHHLPDPARALRSMTCYARTGGHVHVYVYWVPEQRWQRRALRLVTAVRRVTVRVDHRLLHALCYPIAATLLVAFVAPQRALRRRPRGRSTAAGLPLKAYADYPFGVLVNDQFDRFSAPLERRYTAQEVRQSLTAAGLEDVVVLPNHGWLGDGRRPAGAGRAR
jgi:SAM-dependent methyltransferase